MKAGTTQTTRAITLVCTASLLLLAAACGGLEEEGDLTLATQETSAAVTSASGAAAGLAAPLVPELQKLFAQRDTVTAEEARQYVEAAYAAYQPCASFQWNGGLSGTITFTGCVLDATGQTIDGSLGISIKIRPQTAMTLTFSKLQVGGNTYDGSLKISVSAGPPRATLAADLSYTSADGDTTVTLQDVTVVRSGGKTTMDGKGTVQTGSVSTAFSAKGLTWNKGDCLPSSGTLTLSAQQTATVVITFLPTTPQTGVVQVQVGSLPATEMALFSPCV